MKSTEQKPEHFPSQDHDCAELEADVVAAMEDSGEDGCPVCGLAPEEHPHV